MSVIAIVPSAGIGRRFGLRGRNKLFAALNGRPILYYTLKRIASSKRISDIVLVVSRRSMKAAKRVVDNFRFKKVRHIVAGGKRRTDSVYNGIKAIKGKVKAGDLILVHDGARPLVGKRIIEDTISAAERWDAAIAAVPVTSTVKKVNKYGKIVSTVDRKGLWDIQTPQAFRAVLLVAAYNNGRSARGATDDAYLIEKMGGAVRVVNGSTSNIKITTKEDLKLAEAILKQDEDRDRI